MAESTKQAVGALVGCDLTVPEAAAIRDFYGSVVGWTSEPLDMGGYEDSFMRSPDTGDIVAGAVHARGVNVDLPPLWVAYCAVADLEASPAALRRGGRRGADRDQAQRRGTRSCVIRDPAGAVLALMQTGESESARQARAA